MKLKRTVLVTGQLAVLAATGFAFIATSPPPDQCDPAGPVRYAVSSSCGPSGYITVTNDARCQLSVTGAEQLNLPNGGRTDDRTTLLSGFGLSELMPYLDDGGIDPDAGRPVANPDGGAALRYFSCTAAPTSDGGTLSTMDLTCTEPRTSRVLCTGTLVQDGQLADAGTDGGSP